LLITTGLFACTEPKSVYNIPARKIVTVDIDKNIALENIITSLEK
jgi:hypothetical protein